MGVSVCRYGVSRPMVAIVLKFTILLNFDVQRVTAPSPPKGAQGPPMSHVTNGPLLIYSYNPITP